MTFKIFFVKHVGGINPSEMYVYDAYGEPWYHLSTAEEADALLAAVLALKHPINRQRVLDADYSFHLRRPLGPHGKPMTGYAVYVIDSYPLDGTHEYFGTRVFVDRRVRFSVGSRKLVDADEVPVEIAAAGALLQMAVMSHMG